MIFMGGVIFMGRTIGTLGGLLDRDPCVRLMPRMTLYRRVKGVKSRS